MDKDQIMSIVSIVDSFFSEYKMAPGQESAAAGNPLVGGRCPVVPILWHCCISSPGGAFAHRNRLS